MGKVFCLAGQRATRRRAQQRVTMEEAMVAWEESTWLVMEVLPTRSMAIMPIRMTGAVGLLVPKEVVPVEVWFD